MNKKDWYSIPNILSYIRLMMVPFFIYYYITAEDRNDFYIATGILVASGVTDALDGYIARRFDQKTKLGTLLDPVADKLTQLAVVAVLMIRWPIFIFLFLLFIVKEGFMLVENIRLYKRGATIDGAEWYGKIATIIFYLTMFVAVIMPNLSRTALYSIVAVASVFQLLSFVSYSKLFKRAHESLDNQQDEKVEM
ncbi:CDP-alcohol phosphatidyltransferase family protein [Alkalibacterium sp. MB6]|uniref:CDP-alcohol phosphatidyltransferase family protein n=1 Tax=Alkalibacterium sp. MB6 TaxID=2081965 RepID=UPI00137B6A6E|nr:CDP-alcohol phosphatidyltransferase family protein [Alkalibacterium sp. MB6]